jgi:hypothetical protein
VTGRTDRYAYFASQVATPASNTDVATSARPEAWSATGAWRSASAVMSLIQ